MLLFNGKESHPRSILKAISWRTLGSIDTLLLGLFFTQDIKAAGAIAGTEVFTKIGLYYLHERAWGSVRWGHSPRSDASSGSADPAPAPAA